MKLKRHIRGAINGIKWQLSTCIIPNLPSQHLRNWGMRRLGMGGVKTSNFFRASLCAVPKNS